MNTKKFHRVEKIFSSCRKKKVFIIHVKNYFHHEKNDFSSCIKNSFHNGNYKKTILPYVPNKLENGRNSNLLQRKWKNGVFFGISATDLI